MPRSTAASSSPPRAAASSPPSSSSAACPAPPLCRLLLLPPPRTATTTSFSPPRAAASYSPPLRSTVASSPAPPLRRCLLLPHPSAPPSPPPPHPAPSPPPPPPLPLAVVIVFLLSPLLVSCADLYALVYKGCANQSFPGGGVPPTVAVLSSTLSSQSASSKFYKTSSSSASSSSSSISGLFQCRGDLSSSDCAACVSRAMSSWSDVCGASVAARVQLAGCLALYEISGFPQVSGTQMLFKTCGTGGGGGGGDFEMRRDTAFAQLEGNVGGSNGGFVATSYQQVYAMAQCEGDLSPGDCGQCVTQAVQHVEVECGGASSGQVYLDKCYISYSYYPHGVPHGGVGGQQTAKTVAIVLGGAVGLGFVVICLLFARSLVKKKDDY